MVRRRALRACLAFLPFVVLGSVPTLAGNRLLHLNSWFTLAAGTLAIGLGIGFVIAVIKVSTGKDGTRSQQPSHEQSRGAEEKVSEFFEGLPKEDAVSDDLPCRMGNIDHIVVGPTGLFVIETKSHHGEIILSLEGELLRDGKLLERDFLKQVLGQCLWLKEKLSRRGIKVPYINAVVTFTRAFAKVYQSVRGVQVNENWLLNCITKPNTGLVKMTGTRFSGTSWQ